MDYQWTVPHQTISRSSSTSSSKLDYASWPTFTQPRYGSTTSSSRSATPTPSSTLVAASIPPASSSSSLTSILFTLALAPILLFAIWYITSSLTNTQLPAPPLLRNKRIILLIAHPDDEAMFFSPTLQALTSPALGNHLKILCLSNGDKDGLGAIRSKELIESALTLGVRKREDVFVMDDPRFRDGMDNDWKKEDVCRVLGMAFAPQIVTPSRSSTPSPSPSTPPPTTASKDRRKPKHQASKSTTTTTTTQLAPTDPDPTGPRATIDVLITFDAQGISGHPNHIALHSGARLFLQQIMAGHAGWKCPVTLYTLPTVNILRKYSFILDAAVTLFSGIVSGGEKPAGEDHEGDQVIFINDVAKYWTARRAMVEGHKSQMVWFRWGWIGIGRYMVVNDLKRERIAGA